jgi:hypothetical protein
MARKRRPGTIASTRITNEELIQRLQDEHPHILSATVGHAEFEGVLENSRNSYRMRNHTISIADRAASIT